MQPVINEATGELLADAGEIITAEKAYEIEQAGITQVYLDVEGKEIKVISNGMVDILPFVKSFKITEEELEEIAINEKVRYCVLSEILERASKKADILAELKEHCDDLIPKHIIVDDILASINYMNCPEQTWVRLMISTTRKPSYPFSR